eukprot:g8384.t1
MSSLCVSGIHIPRHHTHKVTLPTLRRPRRTFVRHQRTFTIKAALATTSILESVSQAPPDPILGITEAFKRDDDERKLNLGVGAYRTEELKPYVLNVVKAAEEKMLAKGENKEYLPIDGLPAFKQATATLLFGEDNIVLKEGRVATIQALSGTGALRVGGAFIQRFLPEATIYLSDPTWGNHKAIFTDSGVPWKTYRYFDPKTTGLDFEGMCEDLAEAPTGSIVLLHGCAHNPTGIDPSKEQWSKIAEICETKGLLPFFDVAYQGFATGSLEEDAFAPRLFAEKGMEFIVAQSYSKNLGLYAERIGGLNFVLNTNEVAKRVLSQLKKLARPMYSNPPVHGARIVSEVVSDPEMFKAWKGEMEQMAGRIKSVRKVLYDHLVRLMPEKDWTFVTSQIGMFSFTGLQPAQVENMTGKHHIYMTKDGRISLAGLPSSKAEYLANAIVDSFKNY